MAATEQLIGHEAVLRRLERAAGAGALGHAILFTGPEGVGKTTTALALAAHLLDAAAWPGGPSAHPDLWIEDSEAENLSIERVRAGGRDGPTLQDFLALRPYVGRRRVAVLGRAERLTEQAANSLLKTVEEPPPGTHLLLSAAHFERLPSTVLSRCEVVVLGPVSAAAIADWLTAANGVAPELASLAAPLSAGRPGRALRLATEEGALNAELAALDAFLAAGGGGVGAALTTAAAVAPGAGAEGRERGLLTLAAWAAFARDAACYSAGCPELAVWSAYRPALERWAEDLAPSRIVDILDRIVLASEAVATYAQPRLAFEALLVDVFAGADSPPAVPARSGGLLGPGGPVSGGGAPAGRPSRPRGARRAPARAGG
ncbi:MAG: AAA family ATPase [Candidatus Dormibacteraeota bacterium]|nr:AAA family ATPase [Candidatus Dormibacteraeota bacterium]MBV9525903.1 AAA family ATPase [Candidatus Dormibacteraeota bacterium]